LIAWKSLIGRSNCSRSSAYSQARSGARAGDPDALRGDRGARLVEELHELEESHPALADQVLVRNAHVVEPQFGRVARPNPELAGDLIAGEPVAVALDEDLRVAGVAVVDLGVGLADDDEVVGDGPVRDPHLRPVDHPLVAVLLRACGDRGHVRARLRLRDGRAHHRVAGGHLGQDALLLLVRAELHQRLRAEAGAGDAEADPGSAANSSSVRIAFSTDE